MNNNQLLIEPKERNMAKYLFRMLTIGLFWLTCIGIAWSGDFKDLSPQDLKSKLDSGTKIFLLNPLSDIEFAEGHIPGSVNIPLHLLSTTDKLPEDKACPIVTYCLGPK